MPYNHDLRTFVTCRRALLLMALCLGLLPARGNDSQTVALIVHRPSNVLAWNAVDDEAAFMLGCDQILQDAIALTPALRSVDSQTVNGIYSGMQAGLYFPEGESLYARWRPFLLADIYVESELTREALVWRAGTADGKEYESVVIAQPYRHPMAAAEALVRLVFEAGGVTLDPASEAELARGETSPPDLFFEWAKWIGYRPHWLHHAPWQGPHRSARRIMDEDPAFARGAAWALRMLQIPPKGQKAVPASPLYVPHAMQLLNSRWYEAAMPFLRQQFENPAELREAVKAFKLPELDLAIGFDMSGEPAGAALPPNAPAVKLQVPEGPLFRRHLALTLGGVQAESVPRVLTSLLEGDDAAEVRAAAGEALRGFRAEVVAAPLRRALAEDRSPIVRAAALSSLVEMGICTVADIRQAMQDADAEVRLRLAERLADCDVESAMRQTHWLALLADDAPAVRIAAMHELQASGAEPGAAEQSALHRALTAGSPDEMVAALSWIQARKVDGYANDMAPLLAHDAAAVRAAAGGALASVDGAQIERVIEALAQDPSGAVRQALAEALADNGGTEAAYRAVVFELLQKAGPGTREAICLAAYRMIGEDRAGLARAMIHDPALTVNLAGLQLLERLGDPALTAELLTASAAQHPNEYIRARALQLMERYELPLLRERCLAALQSPWWIVRLEAADILGRLALPEDAAALRLASEQTEDRWLVMALEDALCKAEGRPIAERIRLGLGEREHTEGGDTPNGFQVWLGRLPEDPAERRRLVDEGYRFGAKTVPANMPGGMVLTAYNSSVGARNTYLLDSILGPLEQWRDRLPYLYYLALFDEPGSLGTGYHPDRVRAMLLEAGKPDLLPRIEGLSGDELGAALPPELQRAYGWYNARFGAIASNWVVHLFRLTAQRQYPDLRIFPQSLSYMRQDTQDALHQIDADGDYTWSYHYGNFFRDGTIGAVNRVLNPGKPLCMITWMSWWKPNVLHGNTLYADTEFPEGPWRFRDYMGTRSALALWATGTEAGFFDPISLGQASNKEGQGKQASAFALKPWSAAAQDAVDILLDDPGYWKQAEGKLALKLLQAKGGGDAPDFNLGDAKGGDDDPFMLEEGPTPLQKALAAEHQAVSTTLMTGISYMNIFNTDATRALANLPKPDTRRRDTLIIMGRDYPFFADSSHFPMPAIAVVQGYDMAPTYDSVAAADLLHYDTILLRASTDGVTAELVRGINRWLREKENGLLIVWGNVTSDKVQFPMLTLDTIEEPLLWERDVQAHVREQAEETYLDNRNRERSRLSYPPLATFGGAGRASTDDLETRLHCTFEGNLTPLLTTQAGEIILGRWQATGAHGSIVLLDGATQAGPVYTEALEEIILALDRERGSAIARNPWWGHTLYENDQFVVDVATSQLPTLHAARPRQHRGVDVITGVINPEVRHGECALVLKEYVGPYAAASGDWAVLAREKLVAMTVEAPDRLRVQAEGVTRITHIGEAPLRLVEPAGPEQVADQVLVWKKMREGKPAYSLNRIDGGWELHICTPQPIVVRAGN